MTFGAPLSPVAIAERAARADLAAKLIAAGKIGRTEADRNDQIWAAIGEWASARDADTWAAPQCGWKAATAEATRVAAAALKAYAAGDHEAQARAVGLCKLAGTIAIAADVWTAPAGATPGEEFTTAYLDALQAARPAEPHYQPPEKEMAQ